MADIVRLETLTADNDTLVAAHRVAEANMVRDRFANISQFYGGEWNCGNGDGFKNQKCGKLASVNAEKLAPPSLPLRDLHLGLKD